MHKVDRVAKILGVEARAIFVRAKDAYGCARDNAIRDYNLYCATGAVPQYVDKFLVIQLAKHAERRR